MRPIPMPVAMQCVPMTGRSNARMYDPILAKPFPLHDLRPMERSRCVCDLNREERPSVCS